MCLLLLEDVKQTVGSRADMLILASYQTTGKYRDSNGDKRAETTTSATATTVFTLPLQHTHIEQLYGVPVNQSSFFLLGLLMSIITSAQLEMDVVTFFFAAAAAL